MNRLILILVALAMVVAACSDSSTEAKAATPEGSPARDFTLALEPSGEFVLSQEVKPVYMVFWAEW
jgi:hypothetical protein